MSKKKDGDKAGKKDQENHGKDKAGKEESKRKKAKEKEVKRLAKEARKDLKKDEKKDRAKKDKPKDKPRSEGHCGKAFGAEPCSKTKCKHHDFCEACRLIYRAAKKK